MGKKKEKCKYKLEKYFLKHNKNRENAYDKDVKILNQQNDEAYDEYSEEMRQYESDLQSYTQKQAELKKLYDETLKDFDKADLEVKQDKTLPDEYKNPEIVLKIISYFKNNQASSVNEAIRLYEDEINRELFSKK